MFNFAYQRVNLQSKKRFLDMFKCRCKHAFIDLHFFIHDARHRRRCITSMLSARVGPPAIQVYDNNIRFYYTDATVYVVYVLTYCNECCIKTSKVLIVMDDSGHFYFIIYYRITHYNRYYNYVTS